MPNQSLSQKQQLRILPQQIQLLNLYTLNLQELQLKIEAELEDNPFLEKKEGEDMEETSKNDKDTVKDYQDLEEYAYDDIPDYKLEYNNYINTKSGTPDIPLPSYTDFREDLKKQLLLQCDDEQKIAVGNFIIDSLNDEGILEQSPEDICDDYSFQNQKIISVELFEETLQLIQSLEPAGIGARNIRECMILQLERKDNKNCIDKKSVSLLRDHFRLLETAQFDKVRELLQVDEEEFRIIVSHIGKLKTKPVALQTGGMPSKQTILPDYHVELIDDKLEVSLCRQYASTLFVNHSWRERIMNDKSTDAQTKQYLKTKLASAQWFADAIQQRESNMLLVIKAIVKFQEAYFMDGDIRMLKPMILKNIAEITGLDISTISRFTSNKYADTHFGIVLMKDLFTEGIINTEGTAISNRIIQSTIEELISQENKECPYTDQQIVAILAGKGISLARRTVTKYRELLRIPMSQIRRLWA